MANAAQPILSADQFKASYPDLMPLILEEYPEVDAKSLEGQGRDPEKVIKLIANKTEHTRAKVRRQLHELTDMAAEEEEGRLKHALHVLEERSQELATRFQEEVVPEAEKRMRENLWTSVLSALGLGMVIGLLLGVSRGR